MEKWQRALPPMLDATKLTILLTLSGIVFGVLLGLLIALGRISRNKAISNICWTYIWIFRGTPLLLQIFFIYYALPFINIPLLNISINLSPLLSAILALSLNSAAYLAEIIRAAILSIDNGQMEAAKALGMTYRQAMLKIIVPQSYVRLIPPVGNEFIMLLKDSSLVATIAMTELLRTAKLMTGATGDAFYYLPAAMIYLVLTSIFTKVFDALEKKYSTYI